MSPHEGILRKIADRFLLGTFEAECSRLTQPKGSKRAMSPGVLCPVKHPPAVREKQRLSGKREPAELDHQPRPARDAPGGTGVEERCGAASQSHVEKDRGQA